MSLRIRRCVIVAVAALGLRAVPTGGGGQAAAHDFVRNSIPSRWVEAVLPEDLPPLKYPAYFEDLDKAKVQVHSGRYKTALVTLRKIGDPKPEQALTVALVKGEALAAVGRVDEALKVLSDTATVPGKEKDKETTIARAAAGGAAEGPRAGRRRADTGGDCAAERSPQGAPGFLGRALPARRGERADRRHRGGQGRLRVVRRGAARLLRQVERRRAAAAVRERRERDVARAGGRPVGDAQPQVRRQQRPAEADPPHLHQGGPHRRRLLAGPPGGRGVLRRSRRQGRGDEGAEGRPHRQPAGRQNAGAAREDRARPVRLRHLRRGGRRVAQGRPRSRPSPTSWKAAT